MVYKLLVADDEKLLCDGLQALMRNESDYDIIGKAADGLEAVKLSKELPVDIVVMDIEMPNLNGIEATRMIKEDDRRIKVLILSSYPDKRYVLESLKAGASGYIIKEGAFEELRLALATVIKNHLYLSPEINDFIIEDLMTNGVGKDKDNPYSRLTHREKQIFQLVCEEFSSKEIAQLLSISRKTVDIHRKNVLEKIGVDSYVGLVKYAVREGLIDVWSGSGKNRRWNI
jgi:two-component system, NarL family, response regulator NreC